MTFAALGGYFALMWSPIEGVNLLHAQHGTLIGHHVKIWTTGTGFALDPIAVAEMP